MADFLVILGVRNAKIIHWKEVEPARMTEEHARSIQDKASEKRERSLLQGNAKGLGKQVSKYSEACDRVMLFDWGTMMTFDFTDTSPVRLARFQESKRASVTQTCRLMLLGFLLRAVDWHVAISDADRPVRAHRPTNWVRKQ